MNQIHFKLHCPFIPPVSASSWSGSHWIQSLLVMCQDVISRHDFEPGIIRKFGCWEDWIRSSAKWIASASAVKTELKPENLYSTFLMVWSFQKEGLKAVALVSQLWLSNESNKHWGNFYLFIFFKSKHKCKWQEFATCYWNFDWNQVSTREDWGAWRIWRDCVSRTFLRFLRLYSPISLSIIGEDRVLYCGK